MSDRAAKLRKLVQKDPLLVEDIRILYEDPYSDQATSNSYGFANEPPLVLLVALDVGPSEAEDSELIPLVEVLLEYGADPNRPTSGGWTPLHYACNLDTRNEYVVKLLMQAGAEPNIRDRRGCTAWDFVKNAGGEEAANIRKILQPHLLGE